MIVENNTHKQGEDCIMFTNVLLIALIIAVFGIVLAMGFSVVQYSIDMCDCSLYDEDEDDDEESDEDE